MASSGLDTLVKSIEEDLDKFLQREIALSNLQDELIKDWLVELEEKVKSLKQQNYKLHLKLGSSAFNPTHI